MTTIQTLGTLETLEPGWAPWSWGSSGSGRAYTLSYEAIYRLQPNVRVCVDFLARNVAQLGLHTFRRVSDTDRVRLRDHPLAVVLEEPNPYTTRYRHIESTMTDLGVWGRAYWLKFRDPRVGLKLLRIPPPYVSVAGGLVPDRYTLTLGSQRLELPPTDVVHFRLPNPENPLEGLSPIETLRPLLEEDTSATAFRTNFWARAARPGAVILRPKDAPPWGSADIERFITQYNEFYSGPENGGKTLVLEDGMTWQVQSQTIEDSQGVEFRKLTREDVARAYHIPLPMVGILEHATYSNIREQHKNLYQDCLGPWLKMFEEDIELQLGNEWRDMDGVYVEFNIWEKMSGSFEEQAAALQTAIGRPWMTADEGRARLNLPSLGGEAAELGVPLNMRVGEAPAAAPLPAGGAA